VVLVPGIAHGHEEGAVTLRSSDIFGGTLTFATETDGEFQGVGLWAALLLSDVVLPAIPEVVFVDEVLMGVELRQCLLDGDGCLIDVLVVGVGVGVGAGPALPLTCPFDYTAVFSPPIRPISRTRAG